MQEKIIVYVGSNDTEKMSIRKFKSLKRKLVSLGLVYSGLYLDGVWFRTEDDPRKIYLAAPITEDQLKKIIPIREQKYYVSDPDSAEYFKSLNLEGLAEQRCFRRVDPVNNRKYHEKDRRSVGKN